MELTQEEIKFVEELREQRAANKRHTDYMLELLRTAYEFEKWLQENGYGATYSTFCDDFGFEGTSRRRTYETVEMIRALAREKS